LFLIYNIALMKKSLFIFGMLLVIQARSQGPGAYDLIRCSSTDGTTWSNLTLFQDSSGVPSIAQHSSGTIYVAFQWFPAPAMSNPAFDKIAIKKSVDGGLSWGQPTLAVFSGYPGTYKRPFDPTIVIADNGQVRMYFSGSKTGSLTLLDSTVHSYSAISPDGVNYTWEPGVRVAVADSVTIDPAVIKIGSQWHYFSPRGAPQAGAFHFISGDGLSWTRTVGISSDFNHNYTGNLMVDGSSVRFYGTPFPQANPVWNISGSDGYTWSGFQNCSGATTSGGANADPAVIKLGAGNYMMIYVSTLSVTVGMKDQEQNQKVLVVYPNPSNNNFNVSAGDGNTIRHLKIYDLNGALVFSVSGNVTEARHGLEKGIYFMEAETDGSVLRKKLLVAD
jgi:hypothetical protein